MDKIVLIFSLLLLFGCNTKKESKEQKPDFKKVDFNYYYLNYLKYNFKSNEISVKYNGLKYVDTINVSEFEKKKMYGSYLENEIYNVKGELFLGNEVPNFDDKLEIFIDNEKISFIEIPNMNVNDKNQNKVNKIVNFHNDIKNIIFKNEGFVNAIDTLSKFLKEKKSVKM